RIDLLFVKVDDFMYHQVVGFLCVFIFLLHCFLEFQQPIGTISCIMSKFIASEASNVGRSSLLCLLIRVSLALKRAISTSSSTSPSKTTTSSSSSSISGGILLLVVFRSNTCSSEATIWMYLF
ncbi:unnamed protein product, partial [Brassica oleracea]